MIGMTTTGMTTIGTMMTGMIKMSTWTLQLGSYLLDDQHTALIIPLVDRTQLEGPELLRITEQADVLEIRADLLWEALTPEKLLEQLANLRSQTIAPLILTFRSAAEGGEGRRSDDVLLHILQVAVRKRLCDAIDLEFAQLGTQHEALLKACEQVAVRRIYSQHNFQGAYTSDEVYDLLTRMKDAGADLPKVASLAVTAEDTLAMIEGSHRAAQALRQGVIGIAMGPKGRLSRLAGPEFGQAATFVVTDQEAISAPGQLSAQAIRNYLT